jgi:hypothetical protein
MMRHGGLMLKVSALMLAFCGPMAAAEVLSPSQVKSAVQGVAAGPPTTAATYGSIAAVIQCIPADLMPPGAMTDAQEKELKEWAARKLCGASIAAEVVLDAVEAGEGDATVLLGSAPSTISLHGRRAHCGVRAVIPKGDLATAAVAHGPGSTVTLVGKLAARDPLVPVKAAMRAGGVSMEVRGWSAARAFFRLTVDVTEVRGAEEPKKPPVSPSKPLPAAGTKPPAPPPASPAKPAQEQKPAAAGKTAQFFGASASGNRIIFIVDRSGSMTDSLDYVKRELKRSIGALDENQEFHVLFYSSGPAVEMPVRQPVKASTANKQSAYTFINGVIPQGETDPSRALERAFACKPDAIYLLTDGEFDREIIGLAKRLNSDGKVKIHTIGFLYRTGETVLKAIAEQNGGQYKFVSEQDLAPLSQ